jgi:GlpG protein
VTKGITAHAEADSGGFAIWVRDENQIDKAREEFEEFRRTPDDRRYAGAEREADAIQREAIRKRELARKNIIEMRGKWSSGLRRNAPLVFVLIAASVGVGMLTGFRSEPDLNNTAIRYLAYNDVGAARERAGLLTERRGFLDSGGARNGKPDGELVGSNGAMGDGGEESVEDSQESSVESQEPEGGSETSDALPAWLAVHRDVLRGQVWRTVTPMLIHFGMWHLVFNLYWLYYLGAQIEDRRGSLRFLLFVLVVAVASNVGQACFTGPLTLFGGMSGVVYGLFGYVWMKSTFDASAGMHVTRFQTVLFIVWFFLCLTGFMGPIANVAHGVGLVFGVVVGYVPIFYKTPGAKT